MIARKLTDVKPSPAQEFKFINLFYPDDLNRQNKIRTEIRCYVIKDIGQRCRRPRPKAIFWRTTRTFSLESSDFEISQSNGTNSSIIPSRYNLSIVVQFSIETNTRTIEFIHFRKCFWFSLWFWFTKSTNTNFEIVVTAPDYQPLKTIWIEIALYDSGVFYITLGNAAHTLNQISGDDRRNCSEALSYFGVSTRKLRHRLNNPTESTSKGIIANILAHICLAVCATFSTISS